ncbi:MAG TPA: helix-hairpin-helix domain-containing protein [Bryobacteraceae bacterium]|nr:helix-hairpin-helix domain-containing protein [Bryobacteraceae bacterium]
MHRKISSLWAILLLLFFSEISFADLPNAPGKATVVRVCGKCHSPEQASSLHQDRFGWEETITKMIKFGAQGSDDDFDTILAYLARNFGPQKPGPININKATMVDLETTLLLRRHEARAILEYRAKDGDFKSLDDLKNVPGLDFKKIEAKKDRVTF